MLIKFIEGGNRERKRGKGGGFNSYDKRIKKQMLRPLLTFFLFGEVIITTVDCC